MMAADVMVMQRRAVVRSGLESGVGGAKEGLADYQLLATDNRKL